MDRFVCKDMDDDGCDDCSSGNGVDPANDGADNQCPGEEGFGLIDEITGIAGFLAPHDKAMFSWPPQNGANLYEVARSIHPGFSADCAMIETPDPHWRDEENPGPSDGFFYLVRSMAPHIGSWGADSSGIERSSVCP